MEKLLQKIYEESKNTPLTGEVASYIPELQKADPEALGVYILDLEGNEYKVGDWDTKFTMQSVSKVITLILALMDNGAEKVFEKIGVEATGDPFNSIVRLELKSLQKPLNPMINAGAIATTALIKGDTKYEKIDRILQFARLVSNNPDLYINEAVYQSESLTGDRNRSLAYFMKSAGTIEGEVEEIVDVYFRQCSIEMDCKDLGTVGALLANNGVSIFTQEQIIPKDICQIVKAVMVTCGLYDASGEFAVNVGIPSKSGVGGGILCAVTNKMGIGVYGPTLDKKGNSVRGVDFLKQLSKELDLSLFS